MAERIALYPGSFDPPTYGHLDLIQRATKIFDRLIVGVARNNAKQCTFSVPERIAMLEAISEGMPTVEVRSFERLSVDFARSCKAVALVRGLRATSDFEYELMMAMTNRELNAEVDTVCLMPSAQHQFLSSRVVKEVAQFGGDITPFVPEEVAERVVAKLRAG